MSSNLADRPPELTSSGEDEFKFGRSAGRSTPFMVLPSSGQDEFNFRRSAGRSTPTMVLTSSGQDEFNFGRSRHPPQN